MIGEKSIPAIGGIILLNLEIYGSTITIKNLWMGFPLKLGNQLNRTYPNNNN